MHQLFFYVPVSHCEQVKKALFEKGAGRFRNYDQCSWQTLGSGQFRPLSGSEPFLGSTGRLERVDEVRVEMVVADEIVGEVVEALIEAHPYEEPAYGVFRFQTCDDLRG